MERNDADSSRGITKRITRYLMCAAFAVVVLVGLALFVPRNSASVDGHTRQVATECAAQAKRNEMFALDLYTRLKSRKGNLVFSPYSISLSLAMTHAGARGRTEQQIAEVLRLGTNHAASTIGDLQHHLVEAGRIKGIQLEMANGLWARQGEPILLTFTQALASEFLAECRYVDFSNAPESARIDINAWISRRTAGNVQNLIPQGGVTKDSTLVLVSAIYFKAGWQTRFDPDATFPSGFYNPDGGVECQMMECTGRFNFCEANEKSGAPKVIELPYLQGRFSMIVLLPATCNGLADLEANLTPQHLHDWLGGMKPTKVAVAMPRFTFDTTFSLAETLETMGITDAFNAENADFSGVSGCKNLWIFSVWHKTLIEVNEEGSKAGSATAVILGRGIPSLPTFLANHPFLFVIRENGSGSILFLGRVMDPSKSS